MSSRSGLSAELGGLAVSGRAMVAGTSGRTREAVVAWSGLAAVSAFVAGAVAPGGESTGSAGSATAVSWGCVNRAR
ncbi:hypothetical protein GCM10027589_17410 [Actinocorallia lasiicapitis]